MPVDTEEILAAFAAGLQMMAQAEVCDDSYDAHLSLEEKAALLRDLSISMAFMRPSPETELMASYKAILANQFQREEGEALRETEGWDAFSDMHGGFRVKGVQYS